MTKGTQLERVSEQKLSEAELWEKVREESQKVIYKASLDKDKTEKKRPIVTYFERMDRKQSRRAHYEKYGYYPLEKKSLNYFERMELEERKKVQQKRNKLVQDYMKRTYFSEQEVL